MRPRIRAFAFPIRKRTFLPEYLLRKKGKSEGCQPLHNVSTGYMLNRSQSEAFNNLKVHIIQLKKKRKEKKQKKKEKASS
jgi:hypothetical protein